MFIVVHWNNTPNQIKSNPLLLHLRSNFVNKQRTLKTHLPLFRHSLLFLIRGSFSSLALLQCMSLSGGQLLLLFLWNYNLGVR